MIPLFRKFTWWLQQRRKENELREELRLILKVQLSDRRNAWEMQADGSYIQRQPRNDAEALGTHATLIALAAQRSAAASAKLNALPTSPASAPTASPLPTSASSRARSSSTSSRGETGGLVGI